MQRGLMGTAALTVVMAVLLLALPFVVPGVSDMPVLMFLIPIALWALRFGLRGGLLAAMVGVAISVDWLGEGKFDGGFIDLAAQGVTFVLVGAVVGRAVDRRRVLERTIHNHRELSLDLICAASFDGILEVVNPAWTTVLGYRREELVGRPFLDFVHPDDRDATIAEAERQTKEGLSVLNFQNRYRASNGSYRWLEWVSRPDPKSKQLIAIARDVTERKRAEDVIANHRTELEQAVHERTAELEEQTRELQTARLETLSRLALAAEYRDDDTHQHTQRVGRGAALLAQELRLPTDEVELIRQAAPLHDIGKIGISDTILLKPGRLTAAERATMQQHVQIGAAILDHTTSPVLRRAQEIALTHHERWDGTGYPQRLRSETIPIAGRIVGLIDVFDALTHARPYKQAFSLEQALSEIEALAGKHFDPTMVDAFMHLNHHELVDANQTLQAISA